MFIGQVFIITKLDTYKQKLYIIVSKTSTGPVLPIIVSGCPANKCQVIPQIAPLIKLSIAAYKQNYIIIITIL